MLFLLVFLQLVFSVATNWNLYLQSFYILIKRQIRGDKITLFHNFLKPKKEEKVEYNQNVRPVTLNWRL